MRLRDVALAAGLALGLTSGAAQAAYTLDVRQLGDDVVIAGSGSIDLTGLAPFLPGNLFGGHGLVDQYAQLIITGGDLGVTYQGSFAGESPFENLVGLTLSTSSSASIFGVQFNGSLLYLPSGYTSGGALGPTSATFASTTFGKLGLKAGVYDVSLPHDSIRINVGAVPLPGSAPLLGAALVALGAVGYGVRRRATTVVI